MEAFEQVVAIAMEECDNLVVSEAVKFVVEKQTKNGQKQHHGYEVDLVGARGDMLVLATVKSFFGSRGVVAAHVCGEGSDDRGKGLYRVLHDADLRSQVIRLAAQRYGYREDQVHLRLYVGRFAASKSGTERERVEKWCAEQIAGGGPIDVVGLDEVMHRVLQVAARKTYRDNAVLATIKALFEGGLLDKPPADSPQKD